MNIHIVIAICFLPLVAFLIICFGFMKIGAGKLLLAALLGMIAVLPIVFVQFFIGDLRVFNERSFSSELVRAIVLNGLIEELWKVAVLFVFPARKMTRHEFFACALVVGLSLGCFENVVYFLRSLQIARASGGMLLYTPVFMRMISADLVHLFCTGLGGLFVWATRHRKQEIMSLFFAVASHGLYNFFVLYRTNIRFFAVAAILFAAMECRVRYTKLAEKVPDSSC